ncbi:Uncharacterised protein [uncultured Roseburia sp.]|uniref:Uncharacterized protein n=1 Tax=Brotonthovivens ammoniilytica TaxID=2981725 RepID=A0ABT2TGD4_9FIRM|nr:hypothetical protein [Brotonthovivens ammoniilytica]MCU6761258.1 hypothetical protein [Brotonthovivens ammoniilytica]SCI23517.1 Uncharacterised protein [uncultured Roseburia sp.]
MFNRKIKRLVLISMIVILLLIFLFLFFKIRKPIYWAQNLKTENVSNIKVTVQPPINDKSYKIFEPDEFDNVVAQINQCAEKFTINPSKPSGLSIVYDITMKNGDIHTVANNEMDIIIDGIYYKGNNEWIRQWLDEVVDEVDNASLEN